MRFFIHRLCCLMCVMGCSGFIAVTLAETSPIAIISLLLPQDNEWTQGKVLPHRLTETHWKGFPLFIVGDDAYSRRWLHQQAPYLRAIHAIGMVARVSSLASKEKMAAESGLPLLTANLTGLSQIVGTTHYPVFIFEDEVRQ